MKPIHVTTENPSNYARLANDAKASGVTLTAGPMPPIRAKYVLSNLPMDRPLQNVIALCKALRKSDARQIAVNGVTVRNALKTRTPIHPSSATLPQLPIPTNQAYDPSVALVIGCFDVSEEHEKAMRAAIAQLSRLDPLPKIVLVELSESCCGMMEGVLDGITGSRYVTLPSDDRYKGLFHKEALFHYAITHLVGNADLFVLHDGDVYPTRTDWISLIRTTIAGKDVIQPFGNSNDTIDPAFAAISCCKALVTKDWPRKTPGLSWAVTRDYWERVGGMNTWAIAGAGDTLWAAEIRCSKEDFAYMKKWTYFNAFWRDIQAARLGYLDVPIVHVNHGPRATRCYNQRHEILNHFAPIADHLEWDLNTLLHRFRVAGCPMQKALLRRRELLTRDDVVRVLKESGTDRPINLVGFGY